MPQDPGIPVSFRVHPDKHPELAAWIENLPEGSRSSNLRRALEIGSGIQGGIGGSPDVAADAILARVEQRMDELWRVMDAEVRRMIDEAVRAVHDAAQSVQAAKGPPTVNDIPTGPSSDALKASFRDYGRKK